MPNEKNGPLAEEPSEGHELKDLEVAFNGPTDHEVFAAEPGEDTSEA